MKRLIAIALCMTLLMLTGCNIKEELSSSVSSTGVTLNERAHTKPDGTDDSWLLDNTKDSDEKRAAAPIFFQRTDGVYIFDVSADKPVFYCNLPSGNNFIQEIDIADKTVYFIKYSRISSTLQKVSFFKYDIKTKTETLIAADIQIMGTEIYKGFLYYYNITSDVISKYNIESGEITKLTATYDIDTKGSVEIYNGNIYFFSSKLHKISANGLKTKVVATRNEYFFDGSFYEDRIYYMDHLADGKDCLVSQDIYSKEKIILDTFEGRLSDDLQNKKLVSHFVLAQDGKVYYSYNETTYSIDINGKNKTELGKFTIEGELFIRNNKLYWYYAENAETGVNITSRISLNDYKLFSYSFDSKSVKEFEFPIIEE